MLANYMSFFLKVDWTVLINLYSTDVLFKLLREMDNYHLVHKDDKWKLKKENSDRAIRTFDTKEEAMDFSKDYMNKHEGSLKIHRLDNTIQEERTYPRSADPQKTKG